MTKVWIVETPMDLNNFNECLRAIADPNVVCLIHDDYVRIGSFVGSDRPTFWPKELKGESNEQQSNT